MCHMAGALRGIFGLLPCPTLLVICPSSCRVSGALAPDETSDAILLRRRALAGLLPLLTLLFCLLNCGVHKLDDIAQTDFVLGRDLFPITFSCSLAGPGPVEADAPVGRMHW